MKKIIVYFFLFGYLFTSTELSELMKIDVLFEHYQEHKGKSFKITFSDFLYMHYINHDDENSDGQKDLPFHHHSNRDCDLANFFLPIVIPTNQIAFHVEYSIEYSEKKNFYDVHSLMKSSYLSSIWQPPQFA